LQPEVVSKLIREVAVELPLAQASSQLTDHSQQAVVLVSRLPPRRDADRIPIAQEISQLHLLLAKLILEPRDVLHALDGNRRRVADCAAQVADVAWPKRGGSDRAPVVRDRTMGERDVTVRDIMSTEIVSVGSAATVAEAATLMGKLQVGSALVMDGD